MEAHQAPVPGILQARTLEGVPLPSPVLTQSLLILSMLTVLTSLMF